MAKKPLTAKRSASRRPRAAVTTSTAGENPLFCFEHADRGTSNSWAFSPTADHAPEVFSKICDFAQLTWREIESHTTGGKKRHRKHHDMPINKICDDAQADIKKRNLGERFGDAIFRFRLSGERRLWGFRQGRVFHVVWWDPDHEVYPSEPRRT